MLNYRGKCEVELKVATSRTKRSARFEESDALNLDHTTYVRHPRPVITGLNHRVIFLPKAKALEKMTASWADT